MSDIKAKIIEVPVEDAENALNDELEDLGLDPEQFIQAVVLSTEDINRSAKIVIFYEE